MFAVQGVGCFLVAFFFLKKGVSLALYKDSVFVCSLPNAG